MMPSLPRASAFEEAYAGKLESRPYLNSSKPSQVSSGMGRSGVSQQREAGLAGHVRINIL